MWTKTNTFVLLSTALGFFHSVYAMGDVTRSDTIAHSSGTGKQATQSSGGSSEMRKLGEIQNESQISTTHFASQDKIVHRPPTHHEGLLSRNGEKRTPEGANQVPGDARLQGKGNGSAPADRAGPQTISEIAQRLRMESKMTPQTSGKSGLHSTPPAVASTRLHPTSDIEWSKKRRLNSPSSSTPVEGAGPKTIAEIAERLRSESRMNVGASGLHPAVTTTQPQPQSVVELSKEMRNNSPLDQGIHADYHRNVLVEKINQQLGLFIGLPLLEPADAVVSSLVVTLLDEYQASDNFSISELSKVLTLLQLIYNTVYPTQSGRVIACHMLLHVKYCMKTIIELPLSIQKNILFILGNTISFFHNGYLTVSGKRTIHLSILMSRLRWVTDLFLWALGRRPGFFQSQSGKWDPPQWLCYQIQDIFRVEGNLLRKEQLHGAFLGAAISTYLTLTFVEDEVFKKLHHVFPAVDMQKSPKWESAYSGTVEHWDTLLNWNSHNLNIQLVKELSSIPEFSQMVNTMEKNHELYFLMQSIELLSKNGEISDTNNWEKLFPESLNPKWRQIIQNIFSIQGSCSVTISMQLLSFFCKYKVNLVDISLIASDLNFMMLLARAIVSFERVRSTRTWIDSSDQQPKHIIEKLLLYFTVNHSNSIFKGYDVHYIPTWFGKHLPVVQSQQQNASFFRLPSVLSSQLWLNMVNHYQYTGTTNIPIQGIYMELVRFAQSKVSQPNHRFKAQVAHACPPV